VSTLAITKKETGSWRMPILQFVIYTISAYILAVSSVNLIKFLGIA
jgi:Fe2+ transport system protein B